MHIATTFYSSQGPRKRKKTWHMETTRKINTNQMDQRKPRLHSLTRQKESNCLGNVMYSICLPYTDMTNFVMTVYCRSCKSGK